MSSNGNRYCFMDVSIGDKKLDRVVFELFYNQCPKTCDNFLALCKGTKNSYGEHLSYQNAIFNRVVKSGYIQGGDLNFITSK